MVTKDHVTNAAETEKIITKAAIFIVQKWGTAVKGKTFTRSYYTGDYNFKLTYTTYNTQEGKREVRIDYRNDNRSEWEKVFHVRIYKQGNKPATFEVLNHKKELGMWEQRMHSLFERVVKEQETLKRMGKQKSQS